MIRQTVTKERKWKNVFHPVEVSSSWPHSGNYNSDMPKENNFNLPASGTSAGSLLTWIRRNQGWLSPPFLATESLLHFRLLATFWKCSRFLKNSRSCPATLSCFKWKTWTTRTFSASAMSRIVKMKYCITIQSWQWNVCLISYPNVIRVKYKIWQQIH